MSRKAWLARVSLPNLEGLLRALCDGRLETPLTPGGLAAAGWGHLAETLEPLAGLDGGALETVLQVAVAERRLRPGPRLELVWTGPEPQRSGSRDTAVVVRRLLGQARRSVILAGFRFDHGEELLAPLHAAMAQRGVGAQIFLDIEGRAPSMAAVESFAAAAVERFLTENWPFGPPLPAFYYDPRTVEPASRASLHAKCVLVDDEAALVTSANFTDRGQTRNLEAGVLIEDPAFAAAFAAHWRALAAGGLMRRVGG